MPLPTTRITLDELRQLAAEVFGVDVRAVSVPWHDHYAIHIGALWSAPIGLHTEYRSIDVSMRCIRDVDGSTEGTHAFNVLFDALEGILRRRSAARTVMPIAPELEGPPSSIRPKIAPPFPLESDSKTFSQALPSEPPEKDDGDRNE